MRRCMTLKVFYNEDSRIDNHTLENSLVEELKHKIYLLSPTILVVDSKEYSGYKEEHMEIIEHES